jgi:hypothetical protein
MTQTPDEPCCEEGIDARARAAALEELDLWLASPSIDVPMSVSRERNVVLAACIAAGSSEEPSRALVLRVWARQRGAAALARLVDVVRAMTVRAQEALEGGSPLAANLVACMMPLLRAGERIGFAMDQVARAPAGTPEGIVDRLSFLGTTLHPRETLLDFEFLLDLAWAMTRALQAVEGVAQDLAPRGPTSGIPLAKAIMGWSSRAFDAIFAAAVAGRDGQAELASTFARLVSALRPLEIAVAHVPLEPEALMDVDVQTSEAAMGQVNATLYELSYKCEQVPALDRLERELGVVRGVA